MSTIVRTYFHFLIDGLLSNSRICTASSFPRDDNSVSVQAPEGALFAEPRLFRACVPPGIHRFRNNLWELESLPSVKRALGYPQTVRNDTPELEAARNIELDLGLQVLV